MRSSPDFIPRRVHRLQLCSKDGSIIGVLYECVSFVTRLGISAACAFCPRYLSCHEIDPYRITIARTESSVRSFLRNRLI